MGRSNLGPLNYTFQGSYIVEAVIQDLISRFGLGEDPIRETTLIFGGQSAGARGAMVNIDFISNFVSSQTNARVIGWLDSPYWLPIDTVVDEISLLEQTRVSMISKNVPNFLRIDWSDLTSSKNLIRNHSIVSIPKRYICER